MECGDNLFFHILKDHPLEIRRAVYISVNWEISNLSKTATKIFLVKEGYISIVFFLLDEFSKNFSTLGLKESLGLVNIKWMQSIIKSILTMPLLISEKGFLLHEWKISDFHICGHTDIYGVIFLFPDFPSREYEIIFLMTW